MLASSDQGTEGQDRKWEGLEVRKGGE